MSFVALRYHLPLTSRHRFRTARALGLLQRCTGSVRHVFALSNRESRPVGDYGRNVPRRCVPQPTTATLGAGCICFRLFAGQSLFAATCAWVKTARSEELIRKWRPAASCQAGESFIIDSYGVASSCAACEAGMSSLGGGQKCTECPPGRPAAALLVSKRPEPCSRCVRTFRSRFTAVSVR